MRIVIEIDETGSPRVATQATVTADDSTAYTGATDLAAMQARGTNAGPAPSREGFGPATEPGVPSLSITSEGGAAHSAGAAPNA
jgi:hypothetical protein